MRSSIGACLKQVKPSRQSSLLSQTPKALRISPRGLYTASIPDFLIPSFPTHPCTSLSSTPASFKIVRTGARCLASSRRTFTSSTSRREVKVTNSKQDDDGNDMIVDISPRAANRLKEIMTKDSNPSLALRVEVQSGGCHGFQYLMSLSNSKEASTEEDIIFEAADGSGAKVVMDEPSLELLKGSTVDFTTELIGSQFKIVGNPAATSSCGCGTSFDVKT